jgi:hypothetical protein
MRRLALCAIAALMATSVAMASKPNARHGHRHHDVYTKPAARKVDSLSRSARRRAKQRLAARRTPEARRRRKASRSSFKSLSTRRAIRVARADFPELLGAEPYRGVRLQGAERVKRYADDYTAVVDSDNSSRDVLVESSLPLVAPDEQGRKSRIDLSLTPNGTALEPVNPAVRLSMSRNPLKAAVLPDIGIGVHPSRADGGAGDASVVDQKLFYGNVSPDSDFLVMPVPTGVETFSQLRSVDSPEDQSLASTFRLGQVWGGGSRTVHRLGSATTRSPGATSRLPPSPARAPRTRTGCPCPCPRRSGATRC